jgi:hypothetical protein
MTMRALQLEAVPEPRPANQYTDSARGNDCPKQMPPRTAKQLRAITRAPDAVKDAYRFQRKAGEWLKRQPKAKGGNPKLPTGNKVLPVAEAPTLEDLGTEKIECRPVTRPDPSPTARAIPRGWGADCEGLQCPITVLYRVKHAESVDRAQTRRR